MARVLQVSHRRQQGDGYCLPACAQMVLAHLGVFRSQEELAWSLGVRPPVGAPTSNIRHLRSSTLSVHYADGSLFDLTEWLAQDVPVIAFVQAGELPHWRGHRFQHAVVIVGLDAHNVYLLDPAVDVAPLSITIDDFLLAWIEMDNVYAVLTHRQA